MPLKYKFFIRMFLATFCAWAIPHIIYRLWQLYVGGITLTIALNSFLLYVFGLALVSGFGVGLIVSLMQWIALRPYITSAWRWLVGLVFAWILGDTIKMILLIVSIKAFPGWSHTQSVLFRLIGQSLAVGIPAGLIQQALLQKRTGIRIGWAIAALLSISSAILIETGNATFRESFAMIDPIYASIIAGIVMATLASLPTLLLKPIEEVSQTIAAASTELTHSAHLANNQP